MQRLIAHIGFLLGAAAGAIIAMSVGSVFGADAPPPSAEYWKARVSTAIVIRESQPITPIPLKLVPQADPGPKPVVWLYSASWCGPCQLVKKDKDKFPFDLRIWDIDQQPAPIPLQSIPCLHWNGADGTGYRWPPVEHPDDQPNYPGAEEFTRIWQATQREVSNRKNHGSEAQPPPNGYPAFEGYQPRYPFAGDLRAHLLNHYGVYEAPTLTQDQMEALYDALQAGYSVQQIRKRFKR